MSDNLSILTEEDWNAAEAFIDHLEKRGRKAPVNTLIALALSFLIFCQGAYWVVTTRAAMEPGPTILETLDSVPSDPAVPAILMVSGQSRKGLLLVQAEAQMRAFDAILAATGFMLFVGGASGLMIVYCRRRDGQRDLLVAKLIRCYLNQMERDKATTPP